MLIKNIENKIKMATTIAIASLVALVIVVVIMTVYAYKTSMAERKKVYVISNNIPVEVMQTDAVETLEIEAKAHINTFHTLFFTLPADEQYIQKTIQKAMYMIDESGLKQYNNLQEKGFYNSILTSTANVSIMADSIVLDMQNKSFIYYGIERIERPTSIMRRQLITSGRFKQVKRTENNPHGILIYNWKTELNKDIDYKPKKTL